MSTTTKPTEDIPESALSISPDIDGIEQVPTSNNLESAQNNSNNIITDSDNEDEFEDAEETEDDDDFEDAQEDDTQVDELDAAALLALTKQRLEKQPVAPSTNHEHTNSEEEKIDSTTSTELDNNSEEEATDNIVKPPQSIEEEKKVDTIYRAIDEANEPVKDQAYYIELAMKKSKEAEFKAMQDDDPGYLMKLAEKKIADAEAKAKEDEAAMGENVMKPVVSWYYCCYMYLYYVCSVFPDCCYHIINMVYIYCTKYIYSSQLTA